MTREEQIEQASIEYHNSTESYNIGKCLSDTCFNFQAGAEWADNHPKNVWHDANEEPIKDTFVLIETSFFKDDLDYYSCNWSTSICPSWEEYVKEYYIKRWAYIDDLLPKGGEE